MRRLYARGPGAAGPLPRIPMTRLTAWSPRHRRLLEDADRDLWLLTGVPTAFVLPGGDHI